MRWGGSVIGLIGIILKKCLEFGRLPGEEATVDLE